MRATVGVTDNDWAAFLRADSSIDEVNFWLPSGAGFQSLNPGEPFLFKTKAPDNRIVGGGFFEEFYRLPVSEAWITFGIGNGVPSEKELLHKIQIYRSHTDHPYEPDPPIGCVVLRNVFFADIGDELAQPPDWGRSIVRWKNYDLDSTGGQYVRFAFETLQSSARVDYNWDRDLVNVDLDLPRYGKPVLSQPRLGQGVFRLAVLDAYGGRCAMSGSKIQPALQAAHIRPYASGGQHEIPNGLLLRSDLHTLFDRGYLGVTPDFRLRVSPRLRSDFGNGAEFYEREERGDVIRLPDRMNDRPSHEALEWHMDHVFKSA